MSACGDIPISEIDVGDEVLAYNEATGETDSYTVVATIQHTDPVIVLLTIDGETLETTADNPFYTEDGEWVEAAELEAGDDIRSVDGDTGEVEAVLFLERTQPMYNLTVAEAHTFFVGEGQWLVHNSPICTADDFWPVTPRDDAPGLKQLKDDFKMSDDEMKFAEQVRERKPNLEVYRTADGDGMGDFVLVDRSNPERPAGFIVELKSPGTSPQGSYQLVRKHDAAKWFKFGNRWIAKEAGPNEWLDIITRRTRGTFPK